MCVFVGVCVGLFVIVKESDKLREAETKGGREKERDREEKRERESLSVCV